MAIFEHGQPIVFVRDGEFFGHAADGILSRCFHQLGTIFCLLQTPISLPITFACKPVGAAQPDPSLTTPRLARTSPRDGPIKDRRRRKTCAIPGLELAVSLSDGVGETTG
jgi:hypothetical protein